MKNTRIAIVSAAIGTMTLLSSGASADVYADPGVFAPFGNAQVDFVWVDSNAGYTGELQWVDTAFEGAPQTIWTNHNAQSGQTHRVSRLFEMGERVDFRYDITNGGIDVFATYVENDWAQFSVDASDPYNVLVGIEDIRYPNGDMDHNDAIFRIVFTQAAVPAPGALALLSMGGLLAVPRRR